MFAHALPLLAQRSADAQRLSQTLLWLGILGLIVVVAGIILAALRKRLHHATPRSGDLPFTLGDLRDFHRDGHLTDEEFERVKQQIIALSRGESAPPQPSEDPQDKQNDNFRTSGDDLADSNDKPQ